MRRLSDTQPIGGMPAPPAAAVPPTGSRRGANASQPEPVPARRPLRRYRSLGAEVWRWLIALLVFVAVAAPLLVVSLVVAIYWQARADQTRPVDAIVVMGTAQFNGRPGPVLRARLDRALEAYRQGVAPLVVVTGGRRPGDEFPEAEAARDYLLERGVPAEAILLENEGGNSWRSLQGVAALLRERGLSEVLLVSDGFHLFRVKLMARDLGLSAHATAATDSPISPGGLGELGYVLREAAAVLAYAWETR